MFSFKKSLEDTLGDLVESTLTFGGNHSVVQSAVFTFHHGSEDVLVALVVGTHENSGLLESDKGETDISSGDLNMVSTSITIVLVSSVDVTETANSESGAEVHLSGE